jgi:hypothetical protein
VAAGALSLACLLWVAGCPSLSDIGVGSVPDATVERGSAPEAGADAASDAARRDATVSDATVKDAGSDVPCDANVRADPHNCGRCGHDCVGGACIGGVCAPALLYTGGTPTGILVDGPNLVVTIQGGSADTGYVFRCETASCQATATVLAAGQINPWFPVKQGGSAYWVNLGSADAAAASGGVSGCLETGCPDSGPGIYTPGAGPEGGTVFTSLAADSTYLYWTAITGLNGGAFRCVPSECAATLAQLGGAFGVPYAIAVDPSDLFWFDLNTNEVLRCSLPSCGDNPSIVADLSTAGPGVGVNFSGIALHGGDVYWTEGVADGGVYYCPTSGCAGGPKVMAKNQADPSFVAVDDSGVYWVNGGDGTIVTCPYGGCTKPILVAKASAAFAIALDEESVYFTQSTSNGAVFRVAK